MSSPPFNLPRQLLHVEPPGVRLAEPGIEVHHITTINAYDHHGQPTRITDPNGVVTNITYDNRQRVSTVSVAGETSTYTYEPTGELKRVTLPDSSYIEHTYDPARRLTDVTDNLGNKVTYTLDNAGNRTGEAVRDPASALLKSITRVFDTLGRLQNLQGVEGVVGR